MTVSPLCLVPVSEPRFKDLFGSLTAKPRSLRRLIPADILGSVRLAPSEVPLDVQFESLPVDPLIGLEKEARIGVAIITGSLDELTLDPDLERRQFFNVRPKNEPRQVRRARALLDAARDTNVSVLLFPELTVTPVVLESIRHWLQTEKHSLALVVAGSAHAGSPDDGTSSNTATVLDGTGAVLFTHRKFHPFRERDRDSGVELEEALTIPRPAVTLYRCGDWLLSVLICKDLVDEERRLPQLLWDLQVNFVLTPALSRRTDMFEQVIRTPSQAIVVIANLPGAPDDVCAAAIAAFPRKSDPLVLLPPRPSNSAPPVAPALAWIEIASESRWQLVPLADPVDPVR